MIVWLCEVTSAGSSVVNDPNAPVKPYSTRVLDGMSVVHETVAVVGVRFDTVMFVITGAIAVVNVKSSDVVSPPTAFAEMMRNNPNMTPAIAPLWAHTLDVPYADKLAQVLTAVAPPEVKAILSPQDEGQPSSEELMAKMQQMQQALQQATEIAKEAQQELDECQEKLASKYSDEEAKEVELSIKAYEAVTKRLQVTGANEEQVQEIVTQMLSAMARQPMPTMPEEQETAEIHTPAQEAEAMQGYEQPEQGEQYEQQEMPEQGGEAM